MVKENIKQLLEDIRKNVPLVHNITNYVTVNDCANVVLAVGASPIMADDILEAAEITAISQSLVLNIGTLNQRTVESMIAAGRKANELGIPVVFDPVGAGASGFRNNTVKQILSNVIIAILRGNLSEMSYIAGLQVNTKGVDSAEEDNKIDGVSVAKKVAEIYGCVAAITGAVDVVSDGTRVTKISNGHKMLSKVTGTGCMTTALAGSYAGAANINGSKDYYSAAIGGIMTMGIAGEMAFETAGHMGTGSYHINIIDAVSILSNEIIEERARVNEE